METVNLYRNFGPVISGGNLPLRISSGFRITDSLDVGILGYRADWWTEISEVWVGYLARDGADEA